MREGKAIANAKGEPSYLTNDRDDLLKAIHAVGRASIDPDKVRRYLIDRAKAFGISRIIPSTWNSDGSLR